MQVFAAVYPEVMGACEPLAALGTVERPLARVPHGVAVQVAPVHKRLGAQGALVRALSVVAAFVHLEHTRVPGHIATRGAGVASRPAHFHVRRRNRRGVGSCERRKQRKEIRTEGCSSQSSVESK